MKPYLSIFRERAIEEYIQRQEKEIHPHFLSSAIFIVLYTALCLFLLTGLWALWKDFPIFITGPGVVLSEGSAHVPGNARVPITLFLPAKYASQIHVGAYTQIDVEPAKQQLTGKVTRIEARVISPDEARKRYKLSNTVARAMPQASVAVTIVPTTPGTAHLYAGDSASVQVQIGSKRIFSLLVGR